MVLAACAVGAANSRQTIKGKVSRRKMSLQNMDQGTFKVVERVVEVCALTKIVDNGGEPLAILHENSFVVAAAAETVWPSSAPQVGQNRRCSASWPASTCRPVVR